MPWTAANASHKTKKADTPKEKRQWRDIANDALKRGVSKGTAIRMASGVIKKEEAKRKNESLGLTREPLLIEGDRGEHEAKRGFRTRGATRFWNNKAKESPGWDRPSGYGMQQPRTLSKAAYLTKLRLQQKRKGALANDTDISLFDLVFEKLDYGRWEKVKKERERKTRKPSLLSRVRQGLKHGASAVSSAAQQSMAVR